MSTKEKTNQTDITSLLEQVTKAQPAIWINPNRKRVSEFEKLPVNKSDILKANAQFERFAPYLMKAFPETAATGGIIDSPLVEIENMKQLLNKRMNQQIEGRLLLKCDSELSVAGSVKARGGIYEIFYFAEKIARENGMLSLNDSYETLFDEKFKNLFKEYSIGVGSTGNLGLSIGIISAKMGFNVNVYMSNDAKAWKKYLLRKKGANVVEVQGDFGLAVDEGRKITMESKNGYFIDDENSTPLFMGYSVAAIHLRKQLSEKSIIVDNEHPLFVYLPCGIGNAPGGISFGLRHFFGDNVHCFFAEPTHSPSVLLALATGKMDGVSVYDYGLDNRTEADGLAVARASGFATEINNATISGIYTLEDEELFKLLYMLGKSQEIFVEPSATAGLIGPQIIAASDYMKTRNINPAKVTHIAWATGGSLVPSNKMDIYYGRGKEYLV